MVSRSLASLSLVVGKHLHLLLDYTCILKMLTWKIVLEQINSLLKPLVLVTWNGTLNHIYGNQPIINAGQFVGKKKFFSAIIRVQTGVTITEISMEISQKTKIRGLIQPNYSPSGYFFRRTENIIAHDICGPKFIAAQSVISKS